MMSKRSIIFGLGLLLCVGFGHAQVPQQAKRALNVHTYCYVVKDSIPLLMDVYVPKVQNEHHACIFFMHGGGFVMGTRNWKDIPQFCQQLAKEGYVVISIDYRLGMYGDEDYPILSVITEFEESVNMATEDLFSAIRYTKDSLNGRDGFDINPNYIMLCGSSAGAIMALQADYYLCNRTSIAKDAPEDFHFAGVMAFAGGIFTTEPELRYSYTHPAPTLLCQGTKDLLVPYRQIVGVHSNFFGCSAVAKCFEENKYPIFIRRYKEKGHHVSGTYYASIDLINWFIERYVYEQKPWEIDQLYDIPQLPKQEFGK